MTTQPPDPQAIDPRVYEAANGAYTAAFCKPVVALHVAVEAALACDRRLRGEAATVSWETSKANREHMKQLGEENGRLRKELEDERAVNATLRGETDELRKVTKPAEFAATITEKNRQLAAAHGTIAALVGNVRAEEINSAAWRTRAQKAEATIAGQGERVRELEALVSHWKAKVESEEGETISEVRESCDQWCRDYTKAEQALTRAGWVRDGDGWKDLKKPASETLQRHSAHQSKIGGPVTFNISPSGPWILRADLVAWERGENAVPSLREVQRQGLAARDDVRSREHPTATAGSAGTLSPRAVALRHLGSSNLMYSDAEIVADAIAAAIEVSKP